MRFEKTGKYFGVLLAICWLSVGVSLARSKPTDSAPIPLTVKAGVPLRIVLEKSVPIKHAGTRVEGRIVDPVYVFDRLVIPAGSEVDGRVSKVEGVPRLERVRAITNGDFSPLRKAQIEFDTLVLKGGRRVPLKAVVSQRQRTLIRLNVGGPAKPAKKGLVKEAVAQARQEVRMRRHAVAQAIHEVKAPGKLKRLKTMLLTELPYHKQSIPAGTNFIADLKTPLDLGTENPSPKELAGLGSKIPPGSVVHARLVTPLSSAVDHRGSPVEAVVCDPVFSSNHELILPEGARLKGIVTHVQPARHLGRNGHLRFVFRQIEWPQGTRQRVEASLQAVEVARSAHLNLDSEGGAHVVTSKKRFIVPAIDVLLATSAVTDTDSHQRAIQEGSGDPGNVGGGAVRGGAGFGLVGSVIGMVARSRALSSTFAFYGASWAIYSHILARGKDVIFPKDTRMDIRFGIHESAAPAVEHKGLSS